MDDFDLVGTGVLVVFCVVLLIVCWVGLALHVMKGSKE